MLIGVGQLRAPLGVAIDPFGDIYVADHGNGRIYKFDRSGKLDAEWGVEVYWDAVVPPWESTWRRRPVRMSSPMSVAVDRRDLRDVSIYTGEGSCVRKFTMRGELVRNWGIHEYDKKGKYTLPWPSHLYIQGHFPFDPMGIAVAENGLIYVSEKGNARILVFGPSGKLVSHWGHYGHKEGEFTEPCGVAVGPGGVVYVADTTNNRIQKFSTTGSFLGQWTTAGAHLGELQAPTGVAVDANGNTYVADKNNDRILKFDASGALVAGCYDHHGFKRPSDIDVDRIAVDRSVSMSRHGLLKPPEQLLYRPHGIALDHLGDVCVTEPSRGWVRKLRADEDF